VGAFLETERTHVGRALPRGEDVRFLTGTSRFLDDLHFDDVLHAAFVRSPFPHAEVRGIDAEAARGRPDVAGVYTVADFADRTDRFPVVPAEGAEIVEVTHPLLASSRVRYVGEPVAVVVATSADAAVDAAGRVTVDYEELALEGPLHDEAPDNVLMRWSHSEGDVEGAFAAAERVVRQRMRMPRLIAAPLEPRGAVASYDADADLLTVWVSAQDPYRQRSSLSAMLRRDPERLRIVVPDVGGAFGSKGVPAAETAAVALCALELGRPVKWVETRTENSLAAYQGRGMDVEAELALDGDGRMLALRARFTYDLGAYLYPTTPVPPLTAAKLSVGCYAIPAASVEIAGLCTPKVPTGPYRGAGRPEAAFVLERLVDLAAAQTGIERIELRRRNLIRRFPHRTPLGFTYDSGDYEAALDRALALVGQVEANDGLLVGNGIALYVERVGPGWESARVTVEHGGRVVCRMGSTPHGQGHETTFAQIAAEALGVEPNAIEVRYGDTAEIPEGVGTFASRSVTVGGSALLLACRDARAQLDAGASLPVEASARFELPGPVFSSGAYTAVVEIEPETGKVRVVRIVAVDDCGVVVNPLLAEGQVVGATVQALGECLTEQVGYDETGQPLAVNFYDYLLPTAEDVPPIESVLMQTPSPLNPLGAKGIGEAGSIGTPAAVANAVCDALAPLGIRHLDPPFTPARVWEAIAGARSDA
jgi:aerobic carbon-monoxide dehydrogenase large subunit